MSIYFILNSIADAHSIKRVEDFKAAGADIKVFGFLRSKEGIGIKDGFICIGEFSNTLSYHKRIGMYYKGIRSTLRNNSSKDIVWYYLGLDVALIATLIAPHRPYIYEECDMVHANIRSRIAFNLLERIDKHIISKAYKAIFTSEGYLGFHYQQRETWPKNAVLSENKLPQGILNFQHLEKEPAKPNHLRFAFIGQIRYQSLLSIADIITRNFPNYEFHFYGYLSAVIDQDSLPHRDNIFYHGRYKSPDDLPSIYRQTDVVVATYDTTGLNERFAEPNKIYEAIYFRCPIVVSSGTFLSEKVERLGIGYSVKPMDEQDVKQLVQKIEKEINTKVAHISSIDMAKAISDNQYATDIVNSLG